MSLLPVNCEDDVKRCVKCYSGSQTAELIYQSSFWDFYYCFRCRSWFKSSAVGKRITVLITDKSVIKSLTWHYTSNLQIRQSVPDVSSILDRFRRRSVLLAARLCLKLFHRRSYV